MIILLPALVVLAFVAFIAVMAVHLRYFFPGVLDAKYPTVADGDIYPIGSLRRRIYLLGLRSGRAQKLREQRNRALTVMRRNGGQS